MTVDARRAQRGIGAALAALIVVLCFAATSAKADTIYPNVNGSGDTDSGTTFDTGLDFWTALQPSCDLLRISDSVILPLGVPAPLCTPETTHAPGNGTPPGSLQQDSQQAASVGLLGPLLPVSLIQGHTTAVSPVFNVGTDGHAEFDVDVRGQVDALIDLGLFDPAAQADFTFTLTDQGVPGSSTPGGPGRTLLTHDTLDKSNGFNKDGSFSGRTSRSLSAPEQAAIDNAVIAGHSYRIELATTFRSNPNDLAAVVGALSRITAQFDNVRLRVQDGTPNFGPPTATTDPATDITASSATLRGTTNAQGAHATYRFRYGTDPTLTTGTNTTDFDAGRASTDQPRARGVSGLTACKTYYFQISIKHDNPSQGDPTAARVDGQPIQSFTTLGCPGPVAVTNAATSITETSATLNGTVDAMGSATTYRYKYGTAENAQNTTVPVPDGDAGNANGAISRPQSVGVPPSVALTPCTTYFFHIEATNVGGTSTGNTLQFKTQGCQPPAVTTLGALPATNGAQLNSTIDTHGADTTYHYEIRVKPMAPADPPFLPVAGGGTIPANTNKASSTNPVIVTMLAKSTTYEYRAVANNGVAPGDVIGNVVEFTTNGDGAVGPQGPPGNDGGQGPAGPQGGKGDTGSNGTAGTNGTNGANGAPGARGPAGAKGSTPSIGSSIEDILSSNARALIRIDSSVLKVPRRGRDIGRVRVAIYCRRIAERTCSGNMKVRTVNKINPASRGATAKRRVTFSTAPAQLDEGKKGFAILNFNAQRRAVLKRFGSKGVKVTIIVSVIDAANNRQNVRRNATVRLAK